MHLDPLLVLFSFFSESSLDVFLLCLSFFYFSFGCLFLTLRLVSAMCTLTPMKLERREERGDRRGERGEIERDRERERKKKKNKLKKK